MKKYIYATVKNPKCPKEIRKLIKENFGDTVKYQTSEYILTDYGTEIAKKKKTKINIISKEKN